MSNYKIYDYAGGDDGVSREEITSQVFEKLSDVNVYLETYLNHSVRHDIVIENVDNPGYPLKV